MALRQRKRTVYSFNCILRRGGLGSEHTEIMIPAKRIAPVSTLRQIIKLTSLASSVIPAPKNAKVPPHDHRIGPREALYKNTLRVRVLDKKVNLEAIYPP